MNTITQQLYLFLSACRGNWRNSIFIEEPSGFNCLMAMNRDGVPVLIDVRTFIKATHEDIDGDECCGNLIEKEFRELYAAYLLWKLPEETEHCLRALCAEIYGEGRS